ncbi:hypothetical protein [Variovorax sp. Root411]|uniref:hypothetical protein n=1 Tax=Variovorax sp. Root411 TaxID=1736530 RepID=UPI001F2167C5|nr:hypothetical protein [Variovorax sp. Root411]
MLVEQPVHLAVACAVVLLIFASLGPPAWRRVRMLLGVAIAGGLIVGFHWAMGTTPLGVASALRLASAATLALTTRFEDLLAVLEAVLHPLQRLDDAYRASAASRDLLPKREIVSNV